MRYRLALLGLPLLVACVSSTVTDVLPTTRPTLTLPDHTQRFRGKLSASSALNSQRVFVADYHGTVNFAIHPTRQIDCDWSLAGRITDTSVYDNLDGFIDAYSVLCLGKIGLDGTFSFRGTLQANGPDALSGAQLELGDTFTLKGQLQGTDVYGELMVPGVFAGQVMDTSSADSVPVGTLFLAPRTEERQDTIE